MKIARVLAIALLALAATGPATAQAPTRELPEEARKRLSEIIGTWDCEWQWVNPQGEATRTERGTETAVYLIEDRVVELTTQVEGRPAPSKAWMFYSFRDEQFHLVSVDRDGDLWKLAGGLDEFVITSDPRTLPDGGSMQIRFTHEDLIEGKIRATMEYTRDGGETWTLGFHQTLTPRKEMAAAQSPSEDRVEEIVAAMKSLPDFAGRWKGGGWMRRGPQEPQHFVSEEIVESKLDGQILLIEGIHHAKDDPSQEIFHAVALLSYDPEADRYRFRSHTGEGQDSEFEGRVEDGAFVWGHEVRGGQIRYVMRIREDRWEEMGEFSRDGETWTQFFDMKLDRVK